MNLPLQLLPLRDLSGESYPGAAFRGQARASQRPAGAKLIGEHLRDNWTAKREGTAQHHHSQVDDEWIETRRQGNG